jgi:hypothetical protein
VRSESRGSSLLLIYAKPQVESFLAAPRPGVAPIWVLVREGKVVDALPCTERVSVGCGEHANRMGTASIEILRRPPMRFTSFTASYKDDAYPFQRDPPPCGRRFNRHLLLSPTRTATLWPQGAGSSFCMTT